MQLSNVLTLSVVMLSSMVQGFVINNCQDTHRHNLGNNQCHKWTNDKYTFQSDKGCTLIFYSDVGCTGKESSHKKVQNRCSSVGFTPKTLKCVT